MQKQSCSNIKKDKSETDLIRNQNILKIEKVMIK